MSSLADRKTLVLSLSRKTHITLLNVAARANKDVEVLVEDLIEATYSRDGKLDRRRDAENRERENQERRDRLGLSYLSPVRSPEDEAEVDRLLKLVSGP